jgi:hypothetical protein
MKSVIWVGFFLFMLNGIASAQTIQLSCSYKVNDTRDIEVRNVNNKLEFVDGIKDGLKCDFTSQAIVCAVEDENAYYREQINRTTGESTVKYGVYKPGTNIFNFFVEMLGQCEITTKF